LQTTAPPVARAKTAVTLFREEKGRWDDPVCLPSAGRSGYRAPGRSRPRPCDLDAPRERPRSGPTDNHFVVESARASTLRCRPRGSPSTEPPSARLLPDRWGRCRAPGCSPFGEVTRSFKRASLGLRLPTDLCNAFRRAGTPASRESSSARGSRLMSAFALAGRLPAGERSPGGHPPTRPLPAAPTRLLAQPVSPRMVFTIARRYRGARHLVPPPRMFPSVASSARPVRWRRPPPSVTSATRVFTPVREMTPRSHAFCPPSPRTPCGGVASFEARTARLMAAASVEGGSSRNCFPEQHGPSSAE
jgi:hypothetical protein